jgi:hypothetical protein
LFHFQFEAVVELAQFGYFVVVSGRHFLLFAVLSFEGEFAFVELVLQLFVFLFEGVDSAGIKLEVELAVDFAVIGVPHVLLQELHDFLAFGRELIRFIALGQHVEKVLQEEYEAFLVVEGLFDGLFDFVHLLLGNFLGLFAVNYFSECLYWYWVRRLIS